ncbi:putative uncharacterized RNA-binding protein [Clavispora lusitaniae]|uniref:RNA-binding protein n=3 Tax=Clavispora lusitaniae TaxID=36911 RepID=C4Y5W0_CLAL4|nr:uncharacterized protein CLUG_03544 [Clavispora lusitaniae ATCC 42720]KAF5210304.1 hypothetical protein E0198_003176 [Clavispora lusitaniae]EEQ39416.1 hypothetical protein CLUG_03544 [Clavispora lusitaniae ATCC 42720]KAF7582614.1 Zn-finger in Ran binding protein and others family protein [Clavispora lusitaniae]OVF11159.1 hypothetical protein A9F13_01g06270 [Clavispora lusitaniae]QFZ28304.1 putative uncharacterized RNA-binding protein [Clavispora lusitaniae]
MSDVYVVVHLASTCDDTGIYVPRDACELIELSWTTVDAKTLQMSPRESVLVKPTNTPVTPACQHKYNLTWESVKDGFSFRDAIAEFNKKLMNTIAGKDFSFVTVDLHSLRVSLPREARDKSVVLPVYLQHPRVFDLFNEYSKWQSTHPEAMSYPGSCLSNIITALDVSVPSSWKEDGPNDSQLTVEVYANVLASLVKKSLPLEAHPSVLTKPYDSAHDAKIFLAERSKILYLSNLPPETTQSELESWFTQYGGRPVAFWTLKNVDADSKSQANKAKGISGFAVFSKHEDAADSLYMNGRVLNDRVVEVQASSTRVLDRASELLTPFPPSKNRPRPGDWTCPSCGFSNFQRRIACFRCSFPATSAVAIQEQMYPSSNNVSGNQDPSHTNMRRNKSDDKQGSPAFGGYQDHYSNSHHALKNGNGYNYNHGYSHQNGGNGQRQHFGNSVPFRAGDWKCTNESCLYHNFAKNVCCLKCGGARPSSVNSGHHNGHHSNSSGGNSNNTGNANGHNGITTASANSASGRGTGSAATAIAAATASGQSLNLSNFLNLSSPQSRQGSQAGSSPSPIHGGGLYSNMTPLQQFPYEQQGKQAGSSQLPQHLALLQGQGPVSHSNSGKSQSSSSSPGLYVQKQGYQYRGTNNSSENGVNLLSSQISSLSLQNSGV